MSRDGATQRRAEWEAQAARRAALRGALTAEDAILRALLACERDALAEAASIRATAALLDHDYLAYWVDELGLRAEWRALSLP